MILGAGIYGAAAAYEASRRGLSVLIVDRGDIGGGASSNSMKVAHGGLRYLQSLDLRRSFESIEARRCLLQLAPQYLRPIPFKLDLKGRSAASRLALRAGLRASDLLSHHGNRGLPNGRRVPRSRYPIWHDILIEDTERVLLGFLHAAEAAGTEIRSHTGVERFRERDGCVVGVELAGGGGEFEVGCVLRCIGATHPGQPALLAMNLVLDAPEWLRDGVAIGFRHPDEGRAVFVVPWRGRCIVGTYCRDYPFDPSQALRVEASWIEAFLRWLAPVHRDWTGLRREDVRFVHAGLVPRAPGSRPEPADHPRIERCPDGIVDVQGVKWTTAYGVSCRAVDLAEQALGRSGRATLGPLEALPDPRALLRAYLDRHPELDVPLLADRAHPTRGEVCFAVDCQWARDLGDVLLRRTDLASSGHPGTRVVSAVAEALQRRLGWSERERQDQLETFDADFHFAGNAPPS